MVADVKQSEHLKVHMAKCLSFLRSSEETAFLSAYNINCVSLAVTLCAASGAMTEFVIRDISKRSNI